MKRILIVLCLAALVLMACSSGQYQVKSKQVGDESLYFQVCSPNNKSCGWSVSAMPVMGTGEKAPPVGAYCKPIKRYSNELDCGKSYFHLLMLVPPN